MKKESKLSIKVSEPTLLKVRKHVLKSKHTIGGYYDLAVMEKMERDRRIAKELKEESTK